MLRRVPVLNRRQHRFLGNMESTERPLGQPARRPSIESIPKPQAVRGAGLSTASANPKGSLKSTPSRQKTKPSKAVASASASTSNAQPKGSVPGKGRPVSHAQPMFAQQQWPRFDGSLPVSSQRQPKQSPSHLSPLHPSPMQPIATRGLGARRGREVRPLDQKTIHPAPAAAHPIPKRQMDGQENASPFAGKGKGRAEAQTNSEIEFSSDDNEDLLRSVCSDDQSLEAQLKALADVRHAEALKSPH